MLTDNVLTTNIFNKNPFTTNIFKSPHDDVFEFTNNAVWSDTPYIIVTGSPKILWTWSDGTTDNKATPDAVTCVGIHTLKVTPWSAVISLFFDVRELYGEFKPLEWVRLQQLFVSNNAYSSPLKTFEWVDIILIYAYNGGFNGTFHIYEWPVLELLYVFGHNNIESLTGNFQTQIKMIMCRFEGNAITSPVQIDNMLSDFVVNAENPVRINTCSVDFSGGANSGPTSAGTVNQNILVNTYSWTVTLNPEV